MSAVSAIQSSAVLILQQMARPATSSEDAGSSARSLIAAANGVDDPNASRGAGATQQARAKISEALFKPNAPSVTEMKLHLMKRLGEEFKIKLEGHATHASFGRAIQAEINKIKMQPGGAMMLAALEKKLGFDKLGFSLDTFVNAIIDPSGSDGKKVDAALKEHLGKMEEDEGDAEDAVAALKALLHDEDGLYGLVQN